MSDFNAVAILLGMINLLAYIFIYIFPFIFLIGLPLLVFKRKPKLQFNHFFCLILSCIFFSLIAASLQPWGFNIPLRYIPFLFPLFMVLIAGIILKLASVSRYIAFLIVFFLVFTNCLHIFPFNLAGNLMSDKVENESFQLFIQDNLQFRSFIIEFLYEITHHYSTPNEKIVDFLWSHGAKKTDVLLTNYDMNVMLYASGMKLYQKGIVDEKPNWIVLRKPAAYPEPQHYNFVKTFITPEYERFILSTSDYRYQRDSPHPRLHRFKELNPPIVYIAYPHEVDFIEIYKLKNLA